MAYRRPSEHYPLISVGDNDTGTQYTLTDLRGYLKIIRAKATNFKGKFESILLMPRSIPSKVVYLPMLSSSTRLRLRPAGDSAFTEVNQHTANTGNRPAEESKQKDPVAVAEIEAARR
eukprot:scaffold70131_cov66-Cyclotella_meneghiniana.AAC.3